MTDIWKCINYSPYNFSNNYN